MKEKHIIWDYSQSFNDEFIKQVAEDNPDLSQNEVYLEAAELNNGYLDDERINLNIDVDNTIVAIATLGLWNGPKPGYRLFPSRNIASCLTSQYDPVWYVDEKGDFRCDESHHDGTNMILYREFKPGITETQQQNFLDKVFEGRATRADITRYTRRLGDKIANVYGWQI